MNPNFSCTRAVAKLAKVECSSCKIIDILKYQGCYEGCLGSSRKEQLLAAEKVRQEIGPSIHSELSSKFRSSSESLTSEIDSLKTQVIIYGEDANSLSEQCSGLFTISPSPNIDHKMQELERRLDNIEHVLNEETIDNLEIRDQASVICEEVPTQHPEINWQALMQDIKKLNKKLEEHKFKNDGTKVDMFKLKREKPPSDRPKLMFHREIDSDKFTMHNRNKRLEKHLKRIQTFDSDRFNRVSSMVDRIKTIVENNKKLDEENDGVYLLSKQDLLEISRTVFASYAHMKKTQELVKTYVYQQMERAYQILPLRKKVMNLNRYLDSMR